jgi:hypothetical protein
MEGVPGILAGWFVGSRNHRQSRNPTLICAQGVVVNFNIKGRDKICTRITPWLRKVWVCYHHVGLAIGAAMLITSTILKKTVLRKLIGIVVGMYRLLLQGIYAGTKVPCIPIVWAVRHVWFQN